MARKRTTLATLRRLREIHRDELRVKHAEALEAMGILSSQIVQADAEIAELKSLERNAFGAAQTDIATLLDAQRYQTVLTSQQTTMRQQLQLLETEAERRRAAVVEADREVKALEKLVERKKQEQIRDERIAENKELDEVAGRCRPEVGLWAS